MNYLYKKSQIWFAVIWIIIYVIGASCADELSKIVNIEKLFTVIFLGVMTIVAIVWMKKNQLFSHFGLCKPTIKAYKLLYYIL